MSEEETIDISGEQDVSGDQDVSGERELGSPRLAAALEAADADAIGRALRHDVVIIPLLRAGDELQVRVFRQQQPAATDDEAPDAIRSHGYDLAVFSSVPALAAFIADDPNRDFDVQRGTVLAPFLRDNRALIERVVFDPAGPNPVAASTDAVLAALVPRDDDDHAAWGAPDH